MGTYAADTSVPVERSKSEIERTLERYGADTFMYGWDRAANAAVIAFEIEGRRIRIVVPMPKREQFVATVTGRKRATSVIDSEWEQRKRQRWRAMLLIIKAKLEAVEAGISTIEAEFLSNTLLPNNQTVGEWLAPQMSHVYRTQEMPPMLPGLQTQDFIAGPETIDGELVGNHE